MSHFMLPQRRGERDGKLDGRYGDEALVLMLYEVARLGTHIDDYRISVYGGGNMFPNITPATRCHIGKQNAMAAKQLLEAHGILCNSYQVEGIGHRKLTFDISSGTVQHRHSHTTCDQDLPVCRPAELKIR
jgi:chemotaxis protein CheD